MSDPRPPLSQAEMKKQRRVARDQKRIDRANAKLNSTISKYIAKDRIKKEVRQQKATERLELARKAGRDAIVQTGDTKITLFAAPRKIKKPSAATKPPERNGYARFALTEGQLDRPGHLLGAPKDASLSLCASLASNRERVARTW